MTTWVLLRGLAREARHWGAFPQLLRRRLPAADALLALDLPGNGTQWQRRSPGRIPDYVPAVQQELARRGLQPPYLAVAMSLGGMVALQWSLVRPPQLRGCVLINSSAGGLSPFWQRLQPASYATLGRLLLPGVGALARESAILRLTSNTAAASLLAPGWAEHAREHPLSRGNVLRQLCAAARFRPPAHGPAVPTLLLASSRDRLVHPACSRAMAQAWSLPLREHPRAGHDLPLDDPEWVAREVALWAAALDGAPGSGMTTVM